MTHGSAEGTCKGPVDGRRVRKLQAPAVARQSLRGGVWPHPRAGSVVAIFGCLLVPITHQTALQ
jgi:hypothetical protein